MLYPKNQMPLDNELFRNPTSEYRAAPFWAWNNKLDVDELVWQIEQFKKMGFGGFHMHVRTGLATEYLGAEFMAAIKACVEKARKENMLAWLYDEDRWPSGAAGGIVTKDKRYRGKHLLLTRTPYGAGGNKVYSRTENGELIARFDISLNGDGTLGSYALIGENDKPCGFVLYAYQETDAESSWFNGQAYIDTLSPDAIGEFIRVTHNRYYEMLAEDFGGVIPAIFTDEPQVSRKQTLAFAHEQKDVSLPWTFDLPQTYSALYGESLTEHLPELLWDLPQGRVSCVRYRYHDHVSERFAAAFADQCGAWCIAHNIMLTGHMMEEPTLESQTAALGDAMRSYRSFGLPGIDMLLDHREFTTAKQAQSAARQYGRPGVLSELYGVTNWAFDFRGHKLQGDWQAALGVTVRVPHLSWVSMNGEAKRDYPATFNYQSPWYEFYPVIEDHFARVNTALTRGKALCRVGVIHPVESYWLHWGAKESTASVREQMDRNFQNLTDWLLRGLVDFDFICESLLKGQCCVSQIAKETFPVGESRYEVIIVPPLQTMRATTLERLEAFVKKGGRVIFLGTPPACVDAVQDTCAQRLWELCEQLPFERLALLNALANVRDLEIRLSDGRAAEHLLYQMREEGNTRRLFIAHAGTMKNPDIPCGEILHIQIKGRFSVTLYDTATGEIRPLEAERANGATVVVLPFYEHDSLLLRLDPSVNDCAFDGPPPALVNSSSEGAVRFLSPVPVTLHEPNVLLLDMAEYSLNGAPLCPKEEILRLGNILRRELGWPLRGDHIKQPWVEQDGSTPHKLRLRFSFHSEIAVDGAALALENADITAVTLNGIASGPVNGRYVDKCICKVSLPRIDIGENVLELEMPFGKKTEVEACYLLGDFGVSLKSTEACLTEPVRCLCFGDFTREGLPFYGGNLTYHLETEISGTAMEIAATRYRGQMIRVAVNGKEAGNILFSPYRLKVENLQPGRQKVDLTYVGTRVNTFGQLHWTEMLEAGGWAGPNSWRTSGAYWTYGYNLCPQGVLKSPEIM